MFVLAQETVLKGMSRDLCDTLHIIFSNKSCSKIYIFRLKRVQANNDPA